MSIFIWLLLFSYSTLYAFNNNTIYAVFALLQPQQTTSHPYIHTAVSQRSQRTFAPNSSSVGFPDLSTYSMNDLKNYFTNCGYTEKQILSQTALYMSDEFVTLAKTYSDYQTTIQSLYKKIHSMSFLSRIWHTITGDYWPGLEKRIASLYTEIHSNKTPHPHKIINTPSVQHSNSYNQQQLIRALESRHNQESIVEVLEKNTRSIFNQGEWSNCMFDNRIEDTIDTSLDILRTTSNVYEFIFHTAFVDHLLCEVQEPALSDKPTLLERSPQLLAQALTTFVKNLNPITQAKNTCEFIINTAHFVADATFGKIYLSKQQYKNRIDNFWSTCEALSPSNLAQLEAEQWVDLVAQVAADCVFFGGIGKAVSYLKEIGAVSKAQQQASRIAQKLKNAIDASLAERPLIATVEGYIFRATNEMKQFGGTAKEIITDSKTLLESACNGLLADLEKEMEYLRLACDNKVKGFAEFSNKFLKPDYEHILGIDLYFSKRGIPQIGGFHHDFMQSIERSGIFKFTDKVVHESGFYSAKLCNGENLIKKITFFPSHWPRRHVIDKIYESYNNFITAGLKAKFEKGKYIVKSATNKGVEIEMYITTKGHIVTAYPTLKSII